MSMDLDELREIRVRLEATVNYSPPDNSQEQEFWLAESRAERAEKVLGDLLPVFALVDAVDELKAEVDERIELSFQRHCEEYHPSEMRKGGRDE